MGPAHRSVWEDVLEYHGNRQLATVFPRPKNIAKFRLMVSRKLGAYGVDTYTALVQGMKTYSRTRRRCDWV